MGIYAFIGNELNNLLGLTKEIGAMSEILYSKEADERYRGASVMLNSSIPKYNKLPEEIREIMNVDIGQLERKAVEILFNSGNKDMISEALLQKYGYIIKEKEIKETK
jgi:vacuolar-type H+-ATPase subunit C/Vma6